jgi:hypothetical protein
VYDHEILPGQICRFRFPSTDPRRADRFRIVGWLPGPVNRYVEAVRLSDGATFYFRPEEILPGEVKP